MSIPLPTLGVSNNYTVVDGVVKQMKLTKVEQETLSHLIVGLTCIEIAKLCNVFYYPFSFRLNFGIRIIYQWRSVSNVNQKVYTVFEYSKHVIGTFFSPKSSSIFFSPARSKPLCS